MKLVLDTNILIAALIRKGVTRELLSHPDMEYLVPEHGLEEVKDNQEEICNKSGLSRTEVEVLLAELITQVTIIPISEITHLEEAKKIMEPIHPEDAIFLALALSTHNEGIWSNDKHFQRQKKVRVWTTEELIRELSD